MSKQIFCDCSDVHRLVKETITVANTGTAAAPNNRECNI